MLKALQEKEFGSWDLESLASQIQLSVEEVQSILSLSEETQVVPMSGPPGPLGSTEPDSRSLEDFLADERTSTQDRDFELDQMRRFLDDAILTLKPYHQRIVVSYLGLDSVPGGRWFGLGLSPDESGVSRERVRQILVHVRARIKEHVSDLESKSLAEVPGLLSMYGVDLSDQILDALRKDSGLSSVQIAKVAFGDSWSGEHVSMVRARLSSLLLEGRVRTDGVSWSSAA